ncbi:hypothetical protein WJR50_05220 [Catalinimonas sp. 4WD22]
MTRVSLPYPMGSIWMSVCLFQIPSSPRSVPPGERVASSLVSVEEQE